MAKLDLPLFVAHMNYDYEETTFASTSLPGAALQLLSFAGVGVRPLAGIDQTTLDALAKERSEGRWNGMALFRIDELGTRIDPIAVPVVSAQELNMERIAARSDEKIFVALANHDFREFAIATSSLEDMSREVIKAFGITRDHTDLHDGDFAAAINDAYEGDSWKGFSVVSLDTGTAEITQVAPEDLPFDPDSMFPDIEHGPELN